MWRLLAVLSAVSVVGCSLDFAALQGAVDASGIDASDGVDAGPVDLAGIDASDVRVDAGPLSDGGPRDGGRSWLPTPPRAFESLDEFRVYHGTPWNGGMVLVGQGMRTALSNQAVVAYLPDTGLPWVESFGRAGTEQLFTSRDDGAGFVVGGLTRSDAIPAGQSDILFARYDATGLVSSERFASDATEELRALERDGATWYGVGVGPGIRTTGLALVFGDGASGSVDAVTMTYPTAARFRGMALDATTLYAVGDTMDFGIVVAIDRVTLNRRWSRRVTHGGSAMVLYDARVDLDGQVIVVGSDGAGGVLRLRLSPDVDGASRVERFDFGTEGGAGASLFIGPGGGEWIGGRRYSGGFAIGLFVARRIGADFAWARIDGVTTVDGFGGVFGATGTEVRAGGVATLSALSHLVSVPVGSAPETTCRMETSFSTPTVPTDVRVIEDSAATAPVVASLPMVRSAITLPGRTVETLGAERTLCP